MDDSEAIMWGNRGKVCWGRKGPNKRRFKGILEPGRGQRSRYEVWGTVGEVHGPEIEIQLAGEERSVVPGSSEGLRCVSTERYAMDSKSLVLAVWWDSDGWNPDYLCW